MRKALPVILLVLFSFPRVSHGFYLSVPVMDGGRFPSVYYPVSPSAVWQGDSLTVSFSSGLKGRLKGSVSLHIVPFLISGQDTIRFPELGYFTPSSAKYDIRRQSLSERKTDGKQRVVVRRHSPDVSGYQKTRVIPSSFSGELKILHVLQTCCDSQVIASRSVPLFETNVTFIQPKAETVKERTSSATIRITYPVNHWRVYPDFGGNPEELQRVDGILSPVTTDTATYQVQEVSITGHTSPEDTYEHNMKLSKKRAEGMRDYLQERYGFPLLHISAEGKGEDWDGLRQAVVDSDMKAKDTILSIIDSYDIIDGREKLLMELQGGAPYHYMMRHLFPALRRIEIKITYRVRAFEADEVETLIESRPQDLSLHEIHEMAQAQNNDQTILHRRNEYGREYDIAVRYFPDDDIANINASSAALVRGDMELAWLCLNKVKNNPMASNNLGVYYWLCGKVEEAENYFRKALETDLRRATYNLEQLQKWKLEFSGGDTPPGEHDVKK